MIKQEFRELIQDAVAGGDLPDDLKGRIHPEVIDAWVGLALADFIAKLEKSGESHTVGSMVMGFTVPVVEGTSYYTAQLPVKPLSGDQSLYSVSGTDGGVPYTFHSSGGQNVYLYFLNPTGNPYTLQGDVLQWRECPNSKHEVFVQMIPDFRDLDEETEFSLPMGGGKAIAEYVISMLRSKEGMLEDVVNNQRKDG